MDVTKYNEFYLTEKRGKEKHSYSIDRYTQELARLYGVMDRRPKEASHLAGADYSIADIATFPWGRRHERHGQRLEVYSNVGAGGFNLSPRVLRS
jgi:GSH-dependent disulfide-bond oxidoreductase